MSVKNGVWHDAHVDPPKGELVNEAVLIVKETKGGDRKIAFGAYMSTGMWTTNNGLGKVLWWMPLPKIPED